MSHAIDLANTFALRSTLAMHRSILNAIDTRTMHCRHATRPYTTVHNAGNAAAIRTSVMPQHVGSRVSLYITRHYSIIIFDLNGCKNENCQKKNYDIYFIAAQKIDLGYSLEPPQ